jgi:hypothetical protein
MKWIGQHIWDFISRFRSDVYIDDDATLNVKTIKSESTINLTLPDQSYVNFLNGSQYFGHIGSDIDSRFTVFTLYESIASPVDNFNLYVYEHGATRITTHDGAGTAAHFEIEADGNIELDAVGDIILDAYGKNVYIAFNGTNVVDFDLNNGWMKFMSTNNTNDYFTLGVTSEGATKLATVDADTTAAHFQITADGNITLDAAVDISLEAGGGDITGDADNYTFTSSSSGKPLLTLKATNTTKHASSELRFQKDADNTEDSEYIGLISFYGENNAGTPETLEYAKVIGYIGDQVDGQEAGGLYFGVAAYDGVMTSGLILNGNTNADDRVDVTIGSSPDSITSVQGNLKVNSSIRGKSIYVETCNFSDNLGTDEHFIPFVSSSEATVFSNVATPWMAPVAGKLLKVHWRSSQHCNISSNEMSFRLYKISDGTRWSGTNESLLGTKVVTGPARTTHAIADFTSGLESGAGSETNAFAANDLLGVSIQHSQAQGVTEKITVTLVFELDFSSY